MAELKCPHCGQAFTVDDTEVSSIIQQIRDKEFQKDLKSRIYMYSGSQIFYCIINSSISFKI